MTEVTVEYLKNIQNDPSVLVIDVREPTELHSTGIIPGSINIPLATLEDVLKNLNPDDFSKKFGRNKPSLDTPLVFSCRSGRRSLAALDTAKKLGFLNTKHYPGGWLGWEESLKSEN